jgi:hypothetical protein
MGVDTTYYLVYGIRLDYEANKKFNDRLHEDDNPNDDQHFAIVDGMNGEYIVLGVVIDTKDRYSDNFTEIDVSQLDNQREEYSQEFEKTFPDFTHLIQGEWKILSFVHFS